MNEIDREIEWMQLNTRRRIEGFIEREEKPKWLNWFGFYPAYASVEASKAQLNAMSEVVE